MSKTLHILAAVSIMAAASPAGAMTLAEAVDYAMDHNRDILMVREQIEEREGQVIEARADAFPQLDLLTSGARTRDPGFLNSTFGQELLEGGGSPESSPIPLDAILPRPQTFYEMTLNFSQPLFTWGKVSNAMEAASLGRREMRLVLDDTRQEVAFRVTGAYYDLLLAEARIETLEAAMQARERYLRQTRDFFEVGDGTRLEVLRAESQLAGTRPDLIAARNDRDQARKRLNFLLGRDLDAELATSPVEPVADEFQVPSLDSVATAASARRPDLQRMDVQVQIYDKTINVFKADFRPRADLRGYYGFSTIRTDDLFDRNFESWRVSLEISVPVFDGLRNRGVVKQYAAQKSRAEIQRTQIAEQIRLESRQIIDDCLSAKELYEARRIQLTSAEEEERVARDQYEQNLITMYDLMDSNRRALQARTDMLSARYGLLRRIAELKRVMGLPVEELF